LSSCLPFLLRFIFLERERGKRWWRVRRSSPRSLLHSWHLPAALCPEFSSLGTIPRLYGPSRRTPQRLLHAAEGSDDRPLTVFISNPVEVSYGGAKRAATRRSRAQERTRGPQRRSLWSCPNGGSLVDAALRPRLPIRPTLATPAPPPSTRRRRRRGGAPRLLARALLRPSVRRCHRRTLARTRREPHTEWLCYLRDALRARLRSLPRFQFLRRPLRHRRRILPSVHVGRDARRRRARHPDP
jgi:hypothetical protein